MLQPTSLIDHIRQTPTMLSSGSGRPWMSQSPIQALVGESRSDHVQGRGIWSQNGLKNPLTHAEQACDPTLPEPNYAVNVELAELINRKKANRSAIG